MSQTGRRSAILIGSSQFDKEPLKAKPLKCPERDVDGMHELLAAAELGAFGEVFVFKNSHHQAALDQIEEVLTSAARDDQVLIYYSGHGETDLPGRLYLTATNTDTKKLVSTSIPIDTLRTMIENSLCRKIILILDCCFGGAAGKSFVKGSVDEKLKELARGYGIYILTASTAAQTAQEREGDDYGLLTKHIIAGIKEGVAANDDGLISMDSLYRYVYVQVTAEGYQEPMRWALNVKGEDLIIACSSAIYSEERLQDFIKLIGDLESKRELDENLCDEVRFYIRQNQQKRDKKFFGLINQLYKQELTPGKFTSQWYKIVTPIQPSSSQPSSSMFHPLDEVVRITELILSQLQAWVKSRVGLIFLLAILFTAGVLLYLETLKPQPSGSEAKTDPAASPSPLPTTPTLVPARIEVLRYAQLVEPGGIRFSFKARQSGYLYILTRDDKDKKVQFWLLTSWPNAESNRLEAGKSFVFPATVAPLKLGAGSVPFTLIFSSQQITNPNISRYMYVNLTDPEKKRLDELEKVSMSKHDPQSESLLDGGIVTALTTDDSPLIAKITVRQNQFGN